MRDAGRENRHNLLAPVRCVAQMRLNPEGELETLESADWLALRERLRGVLRASTGAETPYLRVLRKYVHE